MRIPLFQVGRSQTEFNLICGLYIIKFIGFEGEKKKTQGNPVNQPSSFFFLSLLRLTMSRGKQFFSKTIPITIKSADE